MEYTKRENKKKELENKIDILYQKLKAYKIKDIGNNMHFYIQGTDGFREYNISEIEANLTNEMCILKHPMQREHFFGLERIQYLKTKRIKQ